MSIWQLFAWCSTATGTFPSQLCNYSTLVDLYLQTNELHGAACFFTGDVHAATIHQWLFVKIFAGTIPNCIGNLANVGRMYLATNNFSGTFPQLWDVPIRQLDIQLNRFSGKICNTHQYSDCRKLNTCLSDDRHNSVAKLQRLILPLVPSRI